MDFHVLGDYSIKQDHPDGWLVWSNSNNTVSVTMRPCLSICGGSHCVVHEWQRNLDVDNQALVQKGLAPQSPRFLLT
ncbi:hypothetical protein LENED_009167 [Lentinula edodes]|uniref:Uncharacterized protein n=1 Tax=Lentinula edodes TaxID=5353 RepID=A0A1Q3EJ20_LENED|nr:hypothetical protein LENED_009167 [Lentinula edodes]